MARKTKLDAARENQTGVVKQKAKMPHSRLRNILLNIGLAGIIAAVAITPASVIAHKLHVENRLLQEQNTEYTQRVESLENDVERLDKEVQQNQSDLAKKDEQLKPFIDEQNKQNDIAQYQDEMKESIAKQIGVQKDDISFDIDGTYVSNGVFADLGGTYVQYIAQIENGMMKAINQFAFSKNEETNTYENFTSKLNTTPLQLFNTNGIYHQYNNIDDGIYLKIHDNLYLYSSGELMNRGLQLTENRLDQFQENKAIVESGDQAAMGQLFEKLKQNYEYQNELKTKISESLGVDKELVSFDIGGSAFIFSQIVNYQAEKDMAIQAVYTFKDYDVDFNYVSLTNQDGQIVNTHDVLEQAAAQKPNFIDNNGVWTIKGANGGVEDLMYFMINGDLYNFFNGADNKCYPVKLASLMTSEQSKEFANNMEAANSNGQATLQELYNKIMQESNNSNDLEQE